MKGTITVSVKAAMLEISRSFTVRDEANDSGSFIILRGILERMLESLPPEGGATWQRLDHAVELLKRWDERLAYSDPYLDRPMVREFLDGCEPQRSE